MCPIVFVVRRNSCIIMFQTPLLVSLQIHLVMHMFYLMFNMFLYNVIFHNVTQLVYASLTNYYISSRTVEMRLVSTDNCSVEVELQFPAAAILDTDLRTAQQVCHWWRPNKRMARQQTV